MKYHDIIAIESFNERLKALHEVAKGKPPVVDRYMAQQYFKSKEWERIREDVLARDLGYDLGVIDKKCDTALLVHHIDPITDHDIIYNTEKLTSLDNLITTQKSTHGEIHYGVKERVEYVERSPGDTKWW